MTDERKKIELELANKRESERLLIIKQVKSALPEHETRRKLYPIFDIKDKSVLEEDREYTLRKRSGKFWFDKSTYFKINSGQELANCLKAELSEINVDAELNPDRGFVKLIDDKSVHEFFQCCVDKGQLLKIQSKTGEKIPKTERVRIRKSVNFYKGVRDAGKFHVFYEHPEQVFRSGEFDRYVWLKDDRLTTEDFVSWAFFAVSCVLMVKAFLPNLFWGFMEYASIGLLYTPLVVIFAMFVLNVTARALSIITYAVSKGKTCKIFLPNLYRGHSIGSLFSPLSVTYQPEPEISHFKQIVYILGKYSKYNTIYSEQKKQTAASAKMSNKDKLTMKVE
jgi:hypothetical protein